MMQTDPMLAKTYILLAESVWSRAVQRTPRPYYYLRRAQMYKTVNDLLSNNQVGLYQQLIVIIYLATVEYANGQHDLVNMHVTAVDNLVESRGGLRAFVPEKAV